MTKLNYNNNKFYNTWPNDLLGFPLKIWVTTTCTIYLKNQNLECPTVAYHRTDDKGINEKICPTIPVYALIFHNTDRCSIVRPLWLNDKVFV